LLMTKKLKRRCESGWNAEMTVKDFYPEPQHEAQPMRKEGWMLSKLEVLTRARRWSATREIDHRRHWHISEKKKWQYACRPLRTDSLKVESMWHEGWMLEQQTHRRWLLVGNGTLNTYPQQHTTEKPRKRCFLCGPDQGSITG
jgi:hypothetical protein